MKRLLILSLIFFLIPALFAQETSQEPPPGMVSAKIYTHFNYSLDGSSSTAFEVKRVYFGYKRNLDEHFSAEVKLDIGSVNDDSEYALIRRYSYFKNAYLSYNTGNIKTWFGLMDMLQFKVQEKFWGYRYLYKSYMDEYRFGSSADLGAGIQWSPSKIITTDLVFSNGEGYKNLQFDNIYRLGAGLTLNPVKGLVIRGYYTIHTSKAKQMILSGFVGYRMEHFRVGAEYNHQYNYDFNKGHMRYGYSIYSTINVADKWEIFGRYDQMYSNVLDGEVNPWNLGKDGSAIIGGVQYAPIPWVNMSLNYQDWVEYARNGSSEPYIYLNLEIVF